MNGIILKGSEVARKFWQGHPACFKLESPSEESYTFPEWAALNIPIMFSHWLGQPMGNGASTPTTVMDCRARPGTTGQLAL